MPKSKPSKAKQACTNASLSARDLRDKVNATWRLARKAPMFTRRKISVNEVKLNKADEAKLEGKSQKEKDDYLKKKKDRHEKVTRTNRLISKHAYNVAAANAAAYVAEVMKRELGAYRVGVRKESGVAPWYPQVSDGASAMLEQFLSAYAQEATYYAASVRKALHAGKRLSAKLMKLGHDVADEAIFASTTAVPTSIFSLAARKPAPAELTAEEKQQLKSMSPRDKQKFLQKKRAEARLAAGSKDYVAADPEDGEE